MASYDIGLRASPMFYIRMSMLLPADAAMTEHILPMVTRSLRFFPEHGPITKDGFVVADRRKTMLLDERGGYSRWRPVADGDFLTADTSLGLQGLKMRHRRRTTRYSC
ncbi:hypothetical protein ACFRJ8_21075 [Arthrobacter sp. NPDC056886]|uniref:hypothetical protein n=1 Tax=Arthrobacter sp. NPDC056886 TaxID=3345960 RepID=UPI0036700505